MITITKILISYLSRIFIKIFTITLLFAFYNCKKVDSFNVCDPTSEEFLRTLFFKLGIGDNTSHCGYAINQDKGCKLNRKEVMQPENWKFVQSELSKQASLGSRATSVSTISTSGVGNPKWGALSLALNGKLYGMPSGSSTILEIDPNSGTSREIPVPGSITGTHASGVLALNGKIYSIPFNSDFIIVFDPLTESIESIASPFLSEDKKWFGGILAPNGKIYAPPGDASGILVIDPSNNTTYTIASPTAGTFKWISGSLAPNGKIYGAPGSQDSILMIDPSNDVVSTLAITKTGILKWSGLNLGIDGKLYGTPLISNSDVLVLDPFTNNVNYITAAGGTSASGAWFGASLAPNGFIYHTPYYNQPILQIDTSSQSSSLINQPLAGNDKWTAFRLARNGRLYAGPASLVDTLVFDPGSNGAYCDSILFSSYLNN